MDLMYKALNVGYIFLDKYFTTELGTPQGSVVSPLIQIMGLAQPTTIWIEVTIQSAHRSISPSSTFYPDFSFTSVLFFGLVSFKFTGEVFSYYLLSKAAAGEVLDKRRRLRMPLDVVRIRSRFTIHTMFFLIWYLFGIIIYQNLQGLTLTSLNWKERNCFCASVPAAILFICKWYYYNSMIVYLWESAKDINYLHCLNPHLCIGIDHPLTYLLVGGRWRNDFIIKKPLFIFCRFNMNDVKPVSTPLATKLRFSRDDQEKNVTSSIF